MDGQDSIQHCQAVVITWREGVITGILGKLSPKGNISPKIPAKIINRSSLYLITDRDDLNLDWFTSYFTLLWTGLGLKSQTETGQSLRLQEMRQATVQSMERAGFIWQTNCCCSAEISRHVGWCEPLYTIAATQIEEDNDRIGCGWYDANLILFWCKFIRD